MRMVAALTRKLSAAEALVNTTNWVEWNNRMRTNKPNGNLDLGKVYPDNPCSEADGNEQSWSDEFAATRISRYTSPDYNRQKQCIRHSKYYGLRLKRLVSVAIRSQGRPNRTGAKSLLVGRIPGPIADDELWVEEEDMSS